MRSRPRWFVAAFLLTFATVGRGEAPVSVRLRYSATAGCPAAAEFMEAVRARTPLAQFGDEDGAWEVSVSAQSTARTSTGVLSGEGTVPREVSAKSCEDVISALALILALAIDPQASASTTPAPSSASAAPPASAAPKPSAAPATPPSRPAPAPPPPPAPPPAEESVQAFWSLGLAIDGSSAFTSSWVSFHGPAASVELGARWTPLLSPSLRLTGAVGFGSTLTAADATASFHLARARLDLRPIRLELSPSLFAVPYAGFEAGRLTGEGETGGAITEAQTESVLWLALAQGMALEILLAEPLFLIGSIEIREPLRRYQFVFQTPNADVAKVPAVEFGWSAGAALRF